MGVEALILLAAGGCAPPPCFTGVLTLFCFLFFTFWVTSLRLDLRSCELRESLFYLMFMGSPKGSSGSLHGFTEFSVNNLGAILDIS